jgi:hypothetical protein
MHGKRVVKKAQGRFAARIDKKDRVRCFRQTQPPISRTAQGGTVAAVGIACNKADVATTRC